MRIASVSDLHVDFADNRDAFVELAGAVHRGGADVVVVAGDVSHVDEHITLVLRSLRVAVETVAYLPGNHDLWLVPPAAPSEDRDSWRRYREELPALCAAEGCHYLPRGPLELGRVAIAGTTGWYDGSLLRPHARREAPDDLLATGRFGDAQWSDARFARFLDSAGRPMPPEVVARTMERELAAQLEDLDRHPEVEDVVVATHVLGFREALGPSRGLPFDLLDAFMGSRSLGQVIQGSKKVRAAIYGHTHFGARFEVGGIKVHGTPLGYPRERRRWPEGSLVDRALGWIDL